MTKISRINWERSEQGGPLGRHLEHDDRSRAFRLAPSAAPTVLREVHHFRHGSILDQGDLGSCTGNALEGALSCDPLHKRFERHTEKKAVRLYSLATQLDAFDGEYPPVDTGSSGLAVCKAAVQLGRLTGYAHAFGIVEAVRALQQTAVISGFDWYEGFDNPTSAGFVKISGQVRGGHEVVARVYVPASNPLDAVVGFDNSWGPKWGYRGHFYMTVRTWAELLDQDGDVTIPLRG